jgi:hypothetical protein
VRQQTNHVGAQKTNLEHPRSVFVVSIGVSSITAKRHLAMPHCLAQHYPSSNGNLFSKDFALFQANKEHVLMDMPYCGYENQARTHALGRSQTLGDGATIFW